MLLGAASVKILRLAGPTGLGLPPRQLSIPAADIQHAQTRDIARWLEDQCPFEAIGDDPDVGGPSLGIEPRPRLRDGAINLNVVHR